MIKRITKNKFLTTLFAILIVCGFLRLVVLFFALLSSHFFTTNDRFVLNEIVVESPGYWGDKSKMIAGLLRLEIGKGNIFDFDLAEARDILSQQASIESVKLKRDLPDRLIVSITERIPRARLLARDTPKITKKYADGRSRLVFDYQWVLDGTGIVMDKESCLDIYNRLPIIDNRSSADKIVEGAELENVKPALQLINLVMSEHRGFRVAEISFNDDGSLKFLLYLRKLRSKFPYVVQSMPIDAIPKYMKALKAGIERERRSGYYAPNIRFDINKQVLFSR